MTHMVIFRNADGKPDYHQADTMEEAIGFVERLRNSEGVTDSRIFSMEEVPIEFRAVYRVEIVGGTFPEAADLPPLAEAPAYEEDVVEPVVEPLPETMAVPAHSGGGRFGLFGKS